MKETYCTYERPNRNNQVMFKKRSELQKHSKPEKKRKGRGEDERTHKLVSLVSEARTGRERADV